MSNPSATVFIVDDDASVRNALARVLRAEGFTVFAYASAHQYIEAYDPDAPGCLVLDLAMPRLSGLELQQQLASGGAAPSIVFLTGRAHVSDGVQAMKGGAVDFLTKPVETPALVDAVARALAKDSADRLERAEVQSIRKRLATLTPRENQVLRCVVSGLLNKQTAAELGTVEKTIKVHRAHVMEKMQVTSLAELVQLAGRAGIVSTPTSLAGSRAH